MRNGEAEWEGGGRYDGKGIAPQSIADVRLRRVGQHCRVAEHNTLSIPWCSREHNEFGGGGRFGVPLPARAITGIKGLTAQADLFLEDKMEGSLP